jgi:hypothetical protein
MTEQIGLPVSPSRERGEREKGESGKLEPQLVMETAGGGGEEFF